MTTRPNSEVDLSGSLLSSSWAKRCWTFEEGCLSYACNVQLADRAMNPEKLDALLFRNTKQEIWLEYKSRWKNIPLGVSVFTSNLLRTLRGHFALERRILRMLGLRRGFDIHESLKTCIADALYAELQFQLLAIRKNNVRNRVGPKLSGSKTFTGKCILSQEYISISHQSGHS